MKIISVIKYIAIYDAKDDRPFDAIVNDKLQQDCFIFDELPPKTPYVKVEIRVVEEEPRYDYERQEKFPE